MIFLMSMLKLPHITTIHTINPTKKAKPEIRPAVLPAWALRHLGRLVEFPRQVLYRKNQQNHWKPVDFHGDFPGDLRRFDQ